VSLLSRERSAATGSSVATLAVLLSSACCVGPLGVAFAWVGLGSTTLLAIEHVLGPFRPWVLGATALVLGYAFFATYARGDTCEVDAATGHADSAATAGVDRARTASLLHAVVLWGATALFVVLLYFTYIHPNLDVLFGIYL